MCREKRPEEQRPPAQGDKMSKEDDFFGDYDGSSNDVDTGQEDTSEPLIGESPEAEPVFEETPRPAKPKPRPKPKKKTKTKPKPKPKAAKKPKPAKKKKTSKTSRKPVAKKKKAPAAKKKKAGKPKPKK